MIDFETSQAEEFLHSWYLLIISFFTIIYILIGNHFLEDSILVLFLLVIFLKNSIGLKNVFKILFYSLLFSFGIFILGQLYTAKSLQINPLFKLGNFIFYKDSIALGINVMLKLMLASFVSMCTGTVLNFTKIILHLIVHKGLRLFWGYPLLLSLNSITLLKEEFVRIKLNARLRKLSLYERVFIFFPLLVFAIRHSQRGALSLVTRGLNEQKTFYFSYDVNKRDHVILYFFGLLYLTLVLVTIFPLR